jgi:hypothetical protein
MLPDAATGRLSNRTVLPPAPTRAAPYIAATVSCGPRQAPQSPTARACPELSSPRRAVSVRRESDSVGRDHAADDLANFAPVRARPIEKAEVEVTLTQLAHVCEPKAALAIKHEVVGTVERIRTAAFVKALDLARGDIDDVNSAARVGFALPAWAKGRALADLAISAAIADEDSAVRPYGGPILGARDLRDNLEFSVRMRPSESSPLNLDNKHGPSAMAIGPSGKRNPLAKMRIRPSFNDRIDISLATGSSCPAMTRSRIHDQRSAPRSIDMWLVADIIRLFFRLSTRANGVNRGPLRCSGRSRFCPLPANEMLMDPGADGKLRSL